MYICVYYYMSVRTILCFYTRLKNTPTQCNTIFHTGCTPIYILYEIDVHYIGIYLFYYKFVDTSGYTIRARIGNRYIS